MSDDHGDRDVDAPEPDAPRSPFSGPSIPWFESDAAKQAAAESAASDTAPDTSDDAAVSDEPSGVSLLKPTDNAAAGRRSRRRYQGRRRRRGDGEEDAALPADLPADAAETTYIPPTPAKQKHSAPWWELPALVVLAIVIAILVKTFVVQPFYIPSESMEKTLHGCPGCSGDRILVNKVIYDFRDPHPGDIVVFNAPPGWNEIHSTPPSNPVMRTIRGFGQLIGFVPPDSEVLVKRVIAVGGETVWGTDSNGRSVVRIREANGKEHVLNEPYVFNDSSDTHATFGPVTVPKGRLWVMGDHRSNSQDSRYHCSTDAGDGDFGSTCDPKTSTVPVSDVIGKAFVIAWPPSRWRTLGTPATFEHWAMAMNQTLPSASGVLTVVPLYAWRRRRRRNRRARA